MTRKRYYPENIEKPVNTYKVRKVETRKRFTEAAINYIKFKWFWNGFITGVLILGSIYYLQSIGLI